MVVEAIQIRIAYRKARGKSTWHFLPFDNRDLKPSLCQAIGCRQPECPSSEDGYSSLRQYRLPFELGNTEWLRLEDSVRLSVVKRLNQFLQMLSVCVARCNDVVFLSC